MNTQELHEWLNEPFTNLEVLTEADLAELHDLLNSTKE